MTAAKKYICVTAGGSGGHLIPALELAQRWIKQHPEAQIILFTTTKKIDDMVIQQYSSITQIIRLSLPSISLQRIWLLPGIFVKAMGAFIQTMYTLLRKRPDMIISTGGFVSVPVCIAGKLLRIPIDLYELNAIPGKAISLLAKIASRIIITFPFTQRYFVKKNCVYQAYPVRFPSPVTMSKKEAVGFIPRFDQSRVTLFLLGGSQGSVQLNNRLKDFLQKHGYIHNRVQIIHQVGLKDGTDWEGFYQSLAIPAVVFAYTHDIALYYQAADIVVTRAGAGTLFELLFFGKRSLIVPLVTHTTDHQKDNALAMVEAYPALFSLFEQKDIEQSPAMFYQTLSEEILSHTK